MSLIADLSWKENENLGLPELNRRAKIISDAIDALRAYQPSWEAEVSLLREVGLERLNTALLPAFQQIIELTDLGALLSATSASTVEIGGGSKTFVLPEAKRRSFAPTPFLIAYAGGDYDLSMVGTVSSYDRETGTLVILVESFKGEGTFSDWTIGPIATTEDLEALRDQVEAAASQVASDKSAAQTAAGQANTRATDAETARTQAQSALSTFNAIWYGARDTEPEDAALGSQYLDTSQTPNVVKVLTERGWAPTVTISIGGSRHQRYIATEGQTGPFVVDGGFTIGSVNLNGVEFFDGHGVTLDRETGSFEFDNELAAGDLVVFRGYLANDVVDVYTKYEADTRFGVHSTEAKAALADGDEIGVADSAASWGLKKFTLANLISSIFKTARTIVNAQFAAASFKLLNADATPRALSFNLDALTADRTITFPNGNVTLPSGTAITSADVPTTIAGLAAGAVGTYAFLQRTATNTAITANSTVAGSALRYAGVNNRTAAQTVISGEQGGGSPSGTWRALGTCAAYSNGYAATVFKRIS